MNDPLILTLDSPQAVLENVGGKGASLARLAGAGFPVPGGFLITTEAYRAFVAHNRLLPEIESLLASLDGSDQADLERSAGTIGGLFLEGEIPERVAREIVQAYQALPGDAPPVAVRSSATAEDLPDASFAGQQETYLHIRGDGALLETVQRCWASLWTARALDYRARREIGWESVALAVVVQLLVPSEVAGILFTANPVTGKRDQILISASWGLGEAVVSGLVTPDSLVIDKGTGRVISREINAKQVMTVRVPGGTEQVAVPANLQRVPALSEEQSRELTRLAGQIEAHYGLPLDIEWAFADGKFAILQARPITALPDAEPALADRWELPRGAYAAMRNNIVELMTEPLSPLFKTAGLGAVNASMNRMMAGFLGEIDLLPSDPIIAVNQYAYYNGSVKFGPILKLILNTGGILKRMFTGAVERWTEAGRFRYLQIVQGWQASSWRELPLAEILRGVRELSEAAVDAYMAMVSGLIPAAWMSEALFTFFYKVLIKRRSDPPAPIFLMGFDSIPIRSDQSLYDLAAASAGSPDLSAYLLETAADQIAAAFLAGSAPGGPAGQAWVAWRELLSQHLKDYGGSIYSLDYAKPVPADDPQPLIETIKVYLRGDGNDPYQRQQDSQLKRKQAVEEVEGRLKGLRLKLFRKNLARAQRYAPLREDSLAEVGLGYPLLRQMILEVGSRLAAGGAIQEASQIFWLEEAEVQRAAGLLESGEVLEDLSGLVSRRQKVWQAARRVEPPRMLPSRILGWEISRIKSGRGRKDILKGVAASPGRVSAPACVLGGPEDFGSMKTGDVLVASITTPAWTPLFARASGVVTDIGGPLSHGSIVAREYGIPAVLGTDSATKRITSGQVITVEGDTGRVLLGKG